jgi:Xaa-Pro dipeptidase
VSLGRERVRRLQALTRAQGLDAVLISNPRSFRYFSGHFPLLSVSPTRPWYLIVPTRFEPIACVPSIGLDDFTAGSSIASVKAWASPNPADEGRSLLRSTLADLTLDHRRIGLELGREMRMALPLADLDDIRTSLPHVAFVDASAAIWSLRSIKDAYELGKHRAAIQAANEGYAQMDEVLRPGMTEKQAAHRLACAIMQAGADTVAYLACCSGKGGYPSLTRAASDRPLELGDVIGFDVGAVVDGYWCDFTRNFSIGPVSGATQQVLQTLQEAVSEAHRACRPGARVSELRALMHEVCTAAGHAPDPSGRWGHGVGLDFTEPPSLTFDDDCVLRAGMVITLEPSLTLARGCGLVAEDMLSITEHASEMLTR